MGWCMVKEQVRDRYGVRKKGGGVGKTQALNLCAHRG